MARRSTSLVSHGRSASAARRFGATGRGAKPGKTTARPHRARAPARTAASCRSARASSVASKSSGRIAVSAKSVPAFGRAARSRRGKEGASRLRPSASNSGCAEGMLRPSATNGPKPGTGCRSNTRSPGAKELLKRISSVSGSIARTPSRCPLAATDASDCAACAAVNAVPAADVRPGAQLYRVHKVVGGRGPRFGQPRLELVGASVDTHERRTGEAGRRAFRGVGRTGQRSAARQRGFDNRLFSDGAADAAAELGRGRTLKLATLGVIHQMRKGRPR